jgi:hypothetical protein
VAAQDGDTRQAAPSRIASHAQPAGGYIETPDGHREAGEVVVRCAYCDFEAGPVPLLESVQIGREHRRAHG